LVTGDYRTWNQAKITGDINGNNATNIRNISLCFYVITFYLYG